MHAGGTGTWRSSWPLFQKELRRLTSRKWSSYYSTWGEKRMPKNSWCRRLGKEGLTCCSLVSSTNGPKTLTRTRMHRRGPGSLFATRIMASGIIWRPMQGSFGVSSEGACVKLQEGVTKEGASPGTQKNSAKRWSKYTRRSFSFILKIVLDIFPKNFPRLV